LILKQGLGFAKHGGKPMLEDILDKMIELKKWTEGNKPEE
jgi:hypothetical protein